MVARVLPQLTTDVILGMDFLHKYNPHVDWSQNTLSFVIDSRTVAVDASTVPGSIRARLVSASAWLRELRAEPDSDCFLVLGYPAVSHCRGQHASSERRELPACGTKPHCDAESEGDHFWFQWPGSEMFEIENKCGCGNGFNPHETH